MLDVLSNDRSLRVLVPDDVLVYPGWMRSKVVCKARGRLIYSVCEMDKPNQTGVPSQMSAMIADPCYLHLSISL